MFQRITYFLEKHYYASRVTGNPFTQNLNIDIYHISTPEHLQNFLEKVFHLFPKIKIRLVSYLGVDGISNRIPVIEKIKAMHDLDVLPIDEIQTQKPPSGFSVMLYSDKIGLRDESYRNTKHAFTKSGSLKKLIIQGDGCIFQGGLFPRIVRKSIRFALRFLVPLRDREENRIISSRIIPDPGYDPQNLPIPRLCAHSNQVPILNYPFRIVQCMDDGTIIKKQMMQKGCVFEIYKEGYHFSDFIDERPDWNALGETYKKRRWRNMQKLGIQPAVGPGSKLTALDVGCGTGGLVDMLNRKGYDALGIDFSDYAIQTAKFYFPHLKFEVAELDQIIDKGEKYDLIVLSHLIEHIRDDMDFLQKIKSVIKPNGLLYIECPWFDSSIFRFRPFWYRQIDHYREYTKLGLFRLVSAAGYKVLNHEDSLNDEGNEPYQFLLAKLPDI